LKVLGVPHLLVKPFDGATLLETVNRLLTGA